MCFGAATNISSAPLHSRPVMLVNQQTVKFVPLPFDDGMSSLAAGSPHKRAYVRANSIRPEADDKAESYCIARHRLKVMPIDNDSMRAACSSSSTSQPCSPSIQTPSCSAALVKEKQSRIMDFVSWYFEV